MYNTDTETKSNNNFLATLLYRNITALKCFRKDKYSFGISYKYFKRKHDYSGLKKYHNIHKGEKCFIVGTGPSLQIDDIEKIKDFYSFGVNTLYKYYSKTDWRADYYCVIDPNTYGNIKDGFDEYDVKNIFIADNRIQIERKDEARVIPFLLECSSFYRLIYPKYFAPVDFGDDLVDQIYDGASVVYAALQIAVYMGFDEIYLLGVDCNYDKSVLHNEELKYSKDYKYNWTAQTGLTMIQGFKSAQKYAEDHNIKIYNATRGGMLEVFPRIALEDIVKMGVKK